MTNIWLPLTATALAAALTWWCCIRPMVKNRSCCTTAADTDLQEELLRARDELQQLREGATPPAVRHDRPEILDR
ncbi:hypothetical protein OH768_53020 [Streptomyces sp. NBC_01622]|uniref:hypothetical protein n=1 Tax=Streptomyces sp. NBC_01622 TaxID=2975903 RepID=UPI00386CA95D|nr:hypothetical protein OH768_53020 [Streptomyces sp. NBC_01622]